MAKYILFMVIVFFFLAEEAVSIATEHEFNISKSWDYLVFSQLWPPIACFSWQIAGSHHKCNTNRIINSWIVNGIWPSQLTGVGPFYCNDSNRFDSTRIQTIKGQLTRYWPNVPFETQDLYLWAYEWDKYGTCASTIPALNTPYLYFMQGITWLKRFNMRFILKTSGIEPSYEAPVFASDIETAIQNALNVKPLLECKYWKTNDTFYIFKILLCFDKALSLKSCPHYRHDPAADCPTKLLVWYPPIRLDKIDTNLPLGSKIVSRKYMMNSRQKRLNSRQKMLKSRLKRLNSPNK